MATGHGPQARSQGQPAACPAIWLILDETNPNFAIFICMLLLCVRSTQKLLANLFTTSFASCQRLQKEQGGGAEREGGRRIGSTKSNKSPSHDNATFTTAHLSPSCSNLFRLYLCTRIRTVQQHCDSRLDPTRSWVCAANTIWVKYEWQIILWSIQLKFAS